jgi:hypothetical protein
MSELFKVLSIIDPAIDWERGVVTRKAVEQYHVYRKPEIIEAVLKPGAMPTWFYLREIPEELWETFVEVGNDATHKALRYRRAFQAAVVRVENLVGATGQILGRNFEPASVTSNGCLLDEECRRFAFSERLEIGAVAYQRSFFPPRIGGIFHLPPMLVEQWEQRLLQLVGLSSASLPPSSAQESSGSSAPKASRTTGNTTSSVGAHSGSRTAATARAGSRSRASKRRPKRPRRG